MWSVTHRSPVLVYLSLSLLFLSLSLSFFLWDKPNQQIWGEQEPNVKLPSAKEEIAGNDINSAEWMKEQQTPSKVGKRNQSCAETGCLRWTASPMSAWVRVPPCSAYLIHKTANIYHLVGFQCNSRFHKSPGKPSHFKGVIKPFLLLLGRVCARDVNVSAPAVIDASSCWIRVLFSRQWEHQWSAAM